MASMVDAEGSLSHLPRADGSATFSHHGYTVVASVNGPMEAQRRDENPFEAILDVVIRPAGGVGGTRERHLESILTAALRQLVCVKKWPRTVLQVTLQLTQAPGNDYTNSKLVQAQTNLSAVPPLLHAAMLALLSGAVALTGIATCTLVAIPPEGSGGELIADPSPLEISQSKSVHLLGFTGQGQLLLAESEGSFTAREWDAAVALGQQTCCRQMQDGAGMEEDSTGSSSSSSIAQTIRSLTEAKIAADLHWRQ